MGIMEAEKIRRDAVRGRAMRSPEKRQERTNEQAIKKPVLLCPLFVLARHPSYLYGGIRARFPDPPDDERRSPCFPFNPWYPTLSARCPMRRARPFWADPYISTKLLETHPSPDTDLASFRSETIAAIC